MAAINPIGRDPVTGQLTEFVLDGGSSSVPITVAADTVLSGKDGYVTHIPHIMKVYGVLKVLGYVKVGSG